MIRRRFLARITALAAAAALAGLIFIGILDPLGQWRSDTLNRSSIAYSERAKLQANLAKLRAERDSFDDGDFSDLTWTGDRANTLSARIQSIINVLAQDSGAEIRSIAPTSTGTTELHSIEYRIELEAGLDQLTHFLRKIEYHEPTLMVTKGSIRRLTRPGREAPLPLLFVQLDLRAPLPPNMETSE